MSEAGARRVLLVGATGLVGRAVLARGGALPDIALMALARREVPLPRGGHVEMLLAPPEGWSAAIAALKPDVLVSALGTTTARSGKEGLRAVDVELVLESAIAARRAGARHVVLVSSVGADLHARNHYLAMKGEVEVRLQRLRFERLDILRPGMLRGRREDDTRPLELLGQAASPLADALLHGKFARYRSARASMVAAAALQAVRERAAGQFIHEHEAIRRLAAKLDRAAG